MRSLRLAALLVAGVLLALPVALLRGRGRGIVRWWMGALAGVLNLRIRVRGRAPESAALWCANHVSWLDVIVLGAVADLEFVSKAEVRGWPLIGWLASAAGTVFIRRGAGEVGGVSQILAEKLERGRSIALFPEGTTSCGEKIEKLHPRLFGAALASHRPVQPVALRYLERGTLSERAPFIGEQTLFAHLLGILKSKDGIEVEVRLLAQVNPMGLDRRSLAHGVRAIIQSGLNDMGDTRNRPKRRPVSLAA